MSGQIFISYRREESHWSARSLHDRLSESIDRNQIFMDIDAIALGEDFVKAIETTVAKCDVLIAVIGNNWLTSKDDQGARRLDNPDDFVRTEIATALKREIRVIPVLVDDALMPRSTDLPDDLKPLVRRNALQISDTSFDGDCQRLVATIREVLEKPAPEAQEREKSRLEEERPESEEKHRRESERLAAERLENERLDRQRDKDRLEAEERRRESTSNDKTIPPSPPHSQDFESAQAETSPVVEIKGSTKRKTSVSVVALLAGAGLMLILGLTWFAGSKLNHSGRESALVKPIPTPESTPVPQSTQIPHSTPFPWSVEELLRFDKTTGISQPTPTSTLSVVSPDSHFYANRAFDSYKKKDYAKAISDYNTAIRIDPNDATSYYNRGLAYRQQGENDKAQADFAKAKQLGYTGPP